MISLAIFHLQNFVSLGAIYGIAKALSKYCMARIWYFLVDSVHTDLVFCIAAGWFETGMAMSKQNNDMWKAAWIFF